VKPLPRAPLTKEDRLIWLRINIPLNRPPRNPLTPAYFLADRRDAALMLFAQQIARYGPSAIEISGIRVRGWDQQ
jgi:hypothetical protein